MDQPVGTPESTSDDRLWAALAYFFSPIVPVIILLMEDKKNRPFIKANNSQALVTGIVMAVVVMLLSVVTFGCGSLLWFLLIIPALKAYKGEVPNIPVISNFVKQQGW